MTYDKFLPISKSDIVINVFKLYGKKVHFLK